MILVTKDEAIAAGLKRYFTGKACVHGHVAERSVLSSKCLECHNIMSAKDRKENAERYKKRRAESRRRNALKIKAANAKYRAKNRERIAEYFKRIQPRRSEQLRVKRAEDGERIRKRERAWKKKNYAKVRAAALKRRALERGARGEHTHADIEAILLAQNNKCAYCKANLKKVGRHIDHIIPLKRGGSNARSNLQALCAPCNLSKQARDPIDFAQARGLLL